MTKIFKQAGFLSMLLFFLVPPFIFAATPTITLKGFVTDKFQAPIKNVKVSLIYKDGRKQVSDSTDVDGAYELKFKLNHTGVEPENQALPQSFQLLQNYPNPIKDVTFIGFHLPQPAPVNLSIYNVMGQLVKVVTDAVYPAGFSQVKWNGTNRTGSAVASGVYFYRLESANQSRLGKMLLLENSLQISGKTVNVAPQAALGKTRATTYNFALQTEKQGFDDFTEELNIYAVSDTIIEKNIQINLSSYFPLAVGNSWTYLNKWMNQEKEITYSITEKKEINGHDYYVFEDWPFHVISTGLAREACMRISTDGDLIINVNQQDVVIYKFSDLILDSMRVAQFDSIPGVFDTDFVTVLRDSNATVTAPSETFENCLHFTAFWAGSLDSEFDIWFAPGIGPVRIYGHNNEADSRLIKYFINQN